ncbi:MAG: hypothetical protein ACYDH4_10225 [Candidatus Cryosericum sp.]
MLRVGVQNRLDSFTKPHGNLGFPQEIAEKTTVMRERVIPELPGRPFQAIHNTATFEYAGITRGSER